MKDIAPIWAAWDSGNFLGLNKAHGRVTVEKDWMISPFNQIFEDTVWPTADRIGPFRYYQYTQMNLEDQTEVYNIKSISIDRSIDTDAASCTIQIYNSGPNETNFGFDPGYYSFNRGSSAEAQARWGHVSNDWNNVLVPMALIRTYQGWGGYEQGDVGNPGSGKAVWFLIESPPAPGAYFTLDYGDDNFVTTPWETAEYNFVPDFEALYGPGNVEVLVYPTGGEENTWWFAVIATGDLIGQVGVVPTPTISVADGVTVSFSFENEATPAEGGSGPIVPLNLDEAISGGYITITGTWIVDSVTVGTNGMLELKCRDAAKLLIEQMLYPPVIPAAVTPLKYFRWKDTSYNAIWDPGAGLQTAGTSPIPITFANSSTDQIAGNVAFGFALEPHIQVLGHDPMTVVDDGDTYALGYGWPSNSSGEAADWWEIFLGASGADINRVLMQPWGGGYQAYVSVMEGGTWQGESIISYTAGATDSLAGIPYVNSTGLSFETPITIELDRTYTAQRVRVTLKNMPVGGGFTSADTDYRSGMREIAVGLSNLPAAPWTFAIARHFENGYWVVAANGQVFSFGQAGALTDTSGHGISTIIVAAEGHPTAAGFWTLEQSGRVHSYGAAAYLGDAIDVNPALPHDFIDMAVTPSGAGYWLLRSTGGVYAFGDATYYGELPAAADIGRTATAIAAHPSDGGYWMTNYLGEVTGFGTAALGGVTDPRPATGTVAAIEPTETGDGYWIMWGNGQVFHYGDATDVFSGGPGFIGGSYTAGGYGGIWWDLVRTNTPLVGYTQGLWGIRADGLVGAVGANYFGRPGGTDATTRTDGNYLDYFDIIKDLLGWAGFTLASSGFEGTFAAGINGVIESTGIYSEEPLAEDIFDKKPIMDAIRTIAEIVGYLTWVDESGGFHFVAPNWFAPGNFYEDGTRISVIPEIDEDRQLFDYQANFVDDSLRSEIIITNQLPTPTNTSTITTRYIPPGAGFLRGMAKVAIWSNEVFSRASEQQVMAELIGMHIWFAQRTGQTTCFANPCIQINDQVRIWERVSAESYIHYVRGISTQHDFDSGEYTMNLTTHWLGSDTSWVISTDGSTNQNDFIVLSPAVVAFLDGTGSEAANPANFIGYTGG